MFVVEKTVKMFGWKLLARLRLHLPTYHIDWRRVLVALVGSAS